MLKVYGMIAFQFDIHPMLMTIEVDMQNQRGIGNAVCYGLAGNFSINSIRLWKNKKYNGALSLSKWFYFRFC